MTRFLDEKVEEKENSDEEDYEDDSPHPEIIQVARADRDDEVETESDEDEIPDMKRSMSPVSSNSPKFSKSPQHV